MRVPCCAAGCSAASQVQPVRQVDPRLRGVLHVGCKHAPHSAAADAASLGVADGVPICGGPDGALVAQAIPLDTHLQAGVGSQVQRRAQVLRADLEAQQRSCPAAVSEWTCSRTASRHRVRVWQQKSCGYAVGLQKGTESVSSSSCLVDMQPDGRQACSRVQVDGKAESSAKPREAAGRSGNGQLLQPQGAVSQRTNDTSCQVFW